MSEGNASLSSLSGNATLPSEGPTMVYFYGRRYERYNVLRPIAFEGLNMSLHPSGPKLTITCGGCRATFRKRVPMVDNPGVTCPRCGATNVLPIEVKS